MLLSTFRFSFWLLEMTSVLDIGFSAVVHSAYVPWFNFHCLVFSHETSLLIWMESPWIQSKLIQDIHTRILRNANMKSHMICQMILMTLSDLLLGKLFKPLCRKNDVWLTKLIITTKGWALDRVHNSRQPLDHCTLWPWPFDLIIIN